MIICDFEVIMNQEKVEALTKQSSQMVEPAFELFQSSIKSCWQAALNQALQARKNDGLDYELQRKEEELLTTFNDIVKNMFEQTLQIETPEQKQARGTSVFSAVGFDHLELAMAVAQLEAVLKIRYNDLFSLLEKRNKALFYFASIDKQSMPFGIANITQMIKDLFISVPLNDENQLTLMQVFSDQFAQAVPELYKRINAVYIQAGILPNLEQMGGGKKATQTAKKVAITESTDEAQIESFELKDSMMIDLFAALDDIHAYQDASGQNNHVSTSQLSQAINAVNLPKSTKLNFKGVKQLKSLALDHLESHMGIDAPVLPKLASQSMDVVGMLAEAITTDKDLDERVVQAMNVLIKPLLICVINEPDFFNEELHPARQFIEQLLKAGSDWFGCDNLNELLVFGGMIQDGYTGSSKVFVTINQDLTDWLTIEHEEALKGIQKFQAEAAGKDRLRATRQVVSQYITQYVKATPVHFVQAFFNQVLTDAMAMVVLQHGKDSEQWNGLKILARDVLKLTLPEEFNPAYAEKAGVDITRRVCQLMMDLSFKTEDILNTESNFGSYMSWMRASMDPKQFQSKKLSHSSADANQQLGLASPHVNKALSTVEEKIYRQFLALPVGVMLDFLYEEDSERRKILCWQNRELDNLVLSDPTGMKSESRSIKQVVSEMAEGVVVIVEPAQDGYINRMVENTLKKINKRKRA